VDHVTRGDDHRETNLQALSALVVIARRRRAKASKLTGNADGSGPTASPTLGWSLRLGLTARQGVGRASPPGGPRGSVGIAPRPLYGHRGRGSNPSPRVGADDLPGRTGMAYYLNLFTVETWREFKQAGAQVSGFREAMWPRVRSLSPGDRFVCYLAGAYRWVAVLEVTGEPYLAGDDAEQIWEMDRFPARVPVKVVLEVDPLYGPPIAPMLDTMEAARHLKNRSRWGTLFMGSPRGWPEADGKLIEDTLVAARDHPVELELPSSAFRSPTSEVVETESGVVTVPSDSDDDDPADGPATDRAATAHTEMQALLAGLGHAMGFQVYIAQGDRSREWNGQALGDMPGTTSELNLPFPDAALRVIRHIDVLWLDADMIRAAWEVERTTSIFSGLLRMTDLLALQPNLSMPMFLVAPETRRDKVAEQLHRPTFARMRPRPLAEMCQFISFERLRETTARPPSEWRYTRFEFITDELAEWLEPFAF
jgi:hypothetical protein